MKFLYIILFSLLLNNIGIAQHFTLLKSGVFKPENKTVSLYYDSISNKRLIIFKTNLAINTDGAPISYHPQDLWGTNKAINTIANAIVVSYKHNNKRVDTKKAIEVFAKFRDSNYESEPDSFTIVWQNVLTAEKSTKILKPCIFDSGEYKGYYGSATSLQNKLITNKGECECNNQVNPLKIASIVLVGGENNIVKQFGAVLGDLVIAYNPKNKKLVYAIVSDIGPPNNLGEGSVWLNMQLNDQKVFPKTKKETYSLVSKNIIISILPKSKNYQKVLPYSTENINSRVENWLKESGFENADDYISFLETVFKK